MKVSIMSYLVHISVRPAADTLNQLKVVLWVSALYLATGSRKNVHCGFLASC